jgi:hypothetical protein
MEKSLYEIRIAGALAEDWSDWFDGFKISRVSDKDTVLVGEVADSAELHGIIEKIRNLNLNLLSLLKIDP